MKKIFFSLVLLFCFCISINAQKCECEYETTIPSGVSDSSEKTITGIIKFDSESKEMEMKNWLYSFGDDTIVIDSQLNSEWTDERLISVYSAKCPSAVNICEGDNMVVGFAHDTVTVVIINNDLMSEIDTYPFKFSYLGLSYHIEELNDCNLAKLVEKNSTCDSKFVELDCDVYDDLYKLMDEKHCHFGEDEGCTTDRIEEYNSHKTKLKSYCKQILGYRDYTSSCLKKCLGLEYDIIQIEEPDLETGQCGFSGRLISFIANIIRWVKYILPVFVIVLGILDFMKALGADKEDEMKKAQQRFIKRLIAAALLFIVPLILEFVLDKMGFGYDDCGLF